MDAVERGILRDVHLDEGAVVEEEARGHVRHVAASLHPLQEVVQLAPTLVEFQAGTVKCRDGYCTNHRCRIFNFRAESVNLNFPAYLRLVFLGEVLGVLVGGLSVSATTRRGRRGGLFALIELVRQRHLREGGQFTRHSISHGV